MWGGDVHTDVCTNKEVIKNTKVMRTGILREPLDVKDIHTTNFQLLGVDFNRFTDILVLRTKIQKKFFS